MRLQQAFTGRIKAALRTTGIDGSSDSQATRPNITPSSKEPAAWLAVLARPPDERR